MSHEHKYYICKKIDEPKRYVGLTLDEFLPVALIVALCFFFGSLITGFVLAGIVWFTIRYFKKGQGASWFLICYIGIYLYIICKGFCLVKLLLQH